MSPLFISLAAGVLVGLIYALLNVRSPAPPAVALVGLLGMLIGSTLGGKLLHNDSSALIPAGGQAQATADKRPASPQFIAKQAG